MIIEFISVGTEILLGNITNTNARYLAEECAVLGLTNYYQVTVGDNESRLSEAIRTALGLSLIHICSGITIDGKECVIVGRSNIVGKPMALLLLRENGTVTVCHSHTKNLKEVCKRADILVAAIGKPKFFNHEYIKEGAVVIDVGCLLYTSRCV